MKLTIEEPVEPFRGLLFEERGFAMVMKAVTTDFSILEQLGLDRPPVGVKFEFFKPESVKPLETPLAMCEMIREAQNRTEPFYMDKDNENCMGKGAMGMMHGGEPGWAAAGLIGERMGIFKDAGSNMRCMQHYKLFNEGAVNYVVFAQLPSLTFEPDLMLFTGTIDQMELILRAMSYSTGAMYESKSTPVFQCSWLFSYPQLTGKVNFVVMGTGHGTTARDVYERGEVVVSVPSPWFPVILKNLKEMEIVPEAWAMGRDGWLEKEEGIYGKLVSDTIEAGFKA